MRFGPCLVKRFLVVLGVLFVLGVPAASAGGGDEWTLDENSGAIRNTWIDIQSLPSLPPGAINPATGSPFTSAEEIGGLRNARMAGGFGIPALNALGAITIGGSAIYTAYEIGDFFRSKISGDSSAVIPTPAWGTWYPYCGSGVTGDNGSTANCFSASSSWSAPNFGGWGDAHTGGEGVGFGVCANGCWILGGSNGGICANGVVTTACTGNWGSVDNNSSYNAAIQSIVSGNPAYTQTSFNTSAGTVDCKVIGACEIVWRTWDQMRHVIHQSTCDATCYAGANTKVVTVPSSTNGGLAQNKTAADIQCGGFLGSATGTADQAACRAALNYLVNPSCTSGCTGTSTPTVTIPGGGTSAPVFTPFVIPEPQSDEVYSDYLERLREKGWVGTATVTGVITDSPLTGPKGVVSVQDTTASLGPDAISAWPDNPFVLPAKDDALTLQRNSGSAPAVSPSSSSCDCPSLDFGPLESIDVGTRFPFGVVNWVHDMFGTSSGTGYSFSITTPGSSVGGALGTISVTSSWWESTGRGYTWPILEVLITVMFWAFFAFKIVGLGSHEE
jgi:hypothetical protein